VSAGEAIVGSRAAPVVDDLELERVALPAHAHFGAGRTGVLYRVREGLLATGPKRTPSSPVGSETFGTPEGHAVRLDDDGEVIGSTIVNAKWLLERDGKITVTVPSLIETNTDELAEALAAA
jgi:hypothetical protein